MNIIFIIVFTLLAISTLAWLLALVRYIDSLKRIPSLSDYSSDSAVEVSAIIPVRDDDARQSTTMLAEERCIKEIVVVDDHSSASFKDAISELTKLSSKVRVLESDGHGKAAACQAGADVARSEILLFVDADTLVKKGAIARALNLMKEKNLDAVSVIGELRCKGLDKMLTPFSFGLLNSFIPLKNVMDEKSNGFFFGSFIMIKKASYNAIGGHASVSNSILEDKALGEVAKKKGLRIAIAKAEGLISAEWAPGFMQNVKALRRVLSPSMAGKPVASFMISVAMTIFLLFPLLSLLLSFMNPYFLLLSIFALTIQLLFSLLASRSVGVSRVYALAFPLAEIVITLAFWQSFFTAYRHGKIVWKGREYRV
ncbi:MAG: glycosyltransferase family 2 protein [Conexivisphaerales archaeon]